METNIQMFDNPRFGKVRTILLNDEVYFVASDIAKALGYSAPKDAISAHCRRAVKHRISDNQGVPHNYNIIPVTDVYRLVMRSNLPAAESFQDWVYEDVLPSIQKHGGYIMAKDDDTPELIIARALVVANQTIEKANQEKILLRNRISTLQPKADLMDKVMDTDQKIDIGQAAKILELPFGRNTMFKKLREMKVFFVHKNEPRQEYIDRGYFQLKEKWIDRKNHDGFVVIKILVTQKGLAFLAKKFNVVSDSKILASIV